MNSLTESPYVVRINQLKEKYCRDIRSDESTPTELHTFLYLYFMTPCSAYNGMQPYELIIKWYDWLKPIVISNTLQYTMKDIHPFSFPDDFRFIASLTSIPRPLVYQCYMHTVLPLLRENSSYEF